MLAQIFKCYNTVIFLSVTRSLFMADTATTDTSQHMAMILTVIKSQPMEDTTTTVTSQAMAKNPMVTKSRQLTVGTTTTNTSRPMAKNPMVTKSQLTAGTITTDTSRPMATIPTVTKGRCMADTKSMVMGELMSNLRLHIFSVIIACIMVEMFIRIWSQDSLDLKIFEISVQRVLDLVCMISNWLTRSWYSLDVNLFFTTVHPDLKPENLGFLKTLGFPFSGSWFSLHDFKLAD